MNWRLPVLIILVGAALLYILAPKQIVSTHAAEIVEGPDYNEAVHTVHAATKPIKQFTTTALTIEAVTPEMIITYPKIYLHHRILLVGWGSGLVEKVTKQTGDKALPDNCAYVMGLRGAAFGCLASFPRNLLNQFHFANEEDADLVCSVGLADHSEFFLSDCELTPSVSRKMDEREYELETGKTAQ